MTLTEDERTALVEILNTFYGEAKYTGTSIITEDAAHTRRAIAAIRDLLAAHDLDAEPFLGVTHNDVPLKATMVEDTYRPLFPEFDDMADGDDLDALLDSVPGMRVSSFPNTKQSDGNYPAGVYVKRDGEWVTEYWGTGPTRMAAIRNAVAQAQGRGEGE